VIQYVYKVEVSRLQLTIGLGVGWTRWEWTVHVNTLYTVYTLNTMYTLYRGSHMYRCTELHICTEYVEVLKQALNAIAAFGAIFILNFIKTIPPPTLFQLVQTLVRIVSPHSCGIFIRNNKMSRWYEYYSFIQVKKDWEVANGVIYININGLMEFWCPSNKQNKIPEGKVLGLWKTF